jgi:hypothetical protein
LDDSGKWFGKEIRNVGELQSVLDLGYSAFVVRRSSEFRAAKADHVVHQFVFIKMKLLGQQPHQQLERSLGIILAVEEKGQKMTGRSMNEQASIFSGLAANPASLWPDLFGIVELAVRPGV